MVWSTEAEDANMLINFPYPIKNVINDQLALNLFDICLDNIHVNC